MANDKQPSFRERRERIEGIAATLRNVARGLEQDAIDLEAEAYHMAIAEKRFAERRDTRKAGK